MACDPEEPLDGFEPDPDACEAGFDWQDVPVHAHVLQSNLETTDSSMTESEFEALLLDEPESRWAQACIRYELERMEHRPHPGAGAGLRGGGGRRASREHPPGLQRS